MSKENKGQNQLKEEAVEEAVEEAGNNKHKEESPPGFISYEAWIDKGKDPADFKGENAYKAEYGRIQEIRDLKSTMQSVVTEVGDWKSQQTKVMNQQIEQARIAAQAELEKAKEDEDIGGALAAKEKLDNLKPQPVTISLNPVIAEFAGKNPIVDRNSAHYDPEFFADMSMIQRTIINDLTGGNDQVQLTNEQINRSMELAYTKTKQLHPDKFTSSRNNRQSAPASQKRSSQKTDYKTQLKNIGRTKLNKNDVDPANDIYEMLKDKDPAAAEQFAKNVLGEAQ